MVHILGRSHTVTKVSKSLLSSPASLPPHLHDCSRWRPLCKVPLGIRDTPIFKQGHPAEHELRHYGSKGPWLSSGTPCPTDTAPLGRIRQAQDLGLLFFSLVCWQVCPVLQPWLLWLSTKACQRLSRAWASLEAVHSWYMGRRWGQLRRRGWRGTVVHISSSAVHSPLMEMIPRHEGQTPFARLALLPSVCDPGQACLLLSRILGQLQTSMTSFLCVDTILYLVNRTVPISPTKDKIRSLTLCPHLGGSELAEPHTLPANDRVQNSGHRASRLTGR